MDEFIKKAEELKMKALHRIEQKLTLDVSPNDLEILCRSLATLSPRSDRILEQVFAKPKLSISPTMLDGVDKDPTDKNLS